jgi:transcriptional regulator with XRE-family HTH domain
VNKLAIKLKVEEFEKRQKIKGLTDTELAELMEVNRSQIWRVKRGENHPGENFIAGALKAFPEASFDDLFFLDN